MTNNQSRRFAPFLAAKKRFLTFVEDHFSVRLHMWLILLATILSGVVFNRILLRLGMTAMEMRYSLAVLISYVAFFLFLKLWFLLAVESHNAHDHSEPTPGSEKGKVHSARIEELLILDVVDAVPPAGSPAGGGGIPAAMLETQTPEPEPEPKKTASDSGIGVLDVLDAGGTIGDIATGSEGCAAGCFGIVLVVFLVGSIYACGVWFIIEAPAILSEGLFQVLLAGTLVRRMRQMEAPNWVGGVFSLTWKPFMIAGVLAFLVGIWAHETCPLAVRMSESWSCQHTPLDHSQGKFGGKTKKPPLPAEAPPGKQQGR